MKKSHVSMAGLLSSRVVGVYPAFSRAMTVECVVIAVHFIDDATNLSKTFTEYDVKDLRTGQIYPNVRRADSAAGMDDGGDNVLHPAGKMLSGSPTFDPKSSQLSQSDGDRVVITFSYGAQTAPVIIAVVPHMQTAYGTKREQGQRRFTTHKGTSVETQQDGTYQIKRGDTTITLNADESIEVVHKSGSVMRFRDDGSIEVIPQTELYLGDSDLSTLLDGVVHARGIDPFTGQQYGMLGNASRKVLAKK